MSSTWRSKSEFSTFSPVFLFSRLTKACFPYSSIWEFTCRSNAGCVASYSRVRCTRCWPTYLGRPEEHENVGCEDGLLKKRMFLLCFDCRQPAGARVGMSIRARHEGAEMAALTFKPGCDQKIGTEPRVCM